MKSFPSGASRGFGAATASHRAGRYLAALIAAAILLPTLLAVAEARSVRFLAAGGGQVRGLIVGINKYESRSIPTLKGAVADAQDLATTLRSAGVSDRDLTVLIDAAANRQNFQAAMERLVEVSKAGDLVIIAFAGHGSQQPELVQGSEEDGKDEIFLLAGFDTEGAANSQRVIDDEMNHWLTQLAAKKVDVLYIADTCHGGGMLRSADFRSGPLSYRFVQVSMDPKKDTLKPVSTPVDAKVTPDDVPNVTFLAAVNKSSQAPEVRVPGSDTLRGALSYSVARLIREGSDGPVTRQELFTFARQITYEYSNTKQVITTEPSNPGAKLDKAVFRLQVTNDEATSALPPNDPVRLLVRNGNANAASGVSPGRFPIRTVKEGDDPDVVWDVPSGDVLNGVGDVVAHSAQAGDIAAIVDATGAKLAIAALSESALQSMKLLPNDGRFHRGDVVRYHIDGLAGKYLILVNLSGNGRVRFLYPRLKGDTALISEPSFDLPLRVDEPFGSDHLIAIVSDQRLEHAEAAIAAMDDQKAAGKFVDILREIRQSDRKVRFGMAASFTSQ